MYKWDLARGANLQLMASIRLAVFFQTLGLGGTFLDTVVRTFFVKSLFHALDFSYGNLCLFLEDSFFCDQDGHLFSHLHGSHAEGLDSVGSIDRTVKRIDVLGHGRSFIAGSIAIGLGYFLFQCGRTGITRKPGG